MMTDSLRALATFGVGLTLAAPAAVAQADASGGDEAEVRAVVTRQGDTWSSHDAAGYAALFTEDCNVVNVLGWWWKGRNELERKLTVAFSFVFHESHLTIDDVQLHFLKPDIAVAHAHWTMTGAKNPPGGAPVPSAGIQTLVLTRTAGHWLIAEFQNTNGVPERPFPTGPAT
jgi:uncharacterized protein (TIGR02246 family)